MQRGFIHIPIIFLVVAVGIGAYWFYTNNDLQNTKPDEVVNVSPTQEPEPTETPTSTPTLTVVPTKAPFVPTATPTSSEPAKLDCSQFNSSDTTVIKVNLQWVGGLKYEKNWWGWIHTTGDCPGDTKNGKSNIGPINAKDGTLTTPTVGTGQYRININYYDKSGNDGTKGVDVTAQPGVTEITVEVQP